MFLKIMLIGISVMAVCIGIGIAQDNNIALSNQLNGCHRISDNSGYIGFQCLDRQVFVPVSERDQVEGIN